MDPRLSRLVTSQLAVAGAGLVLAGLVAALVVRPFTVGTAGYDSAASVLYFERIVAGQRLEAFLGATPKALLTVVYGLAFSIVPDWRVVSWLAIGAYAAGIAACAVLALRVAGAVAAGFAIIGLIGSAELLTDVDLAYAVSWALLSWAVAGLLLTARRPHFAWAGAALAVGGLARTETLIAVALAGLLIGIAAVLARRRSLPTLGVRDRAPILLGFLALPIQAIHDWLLTGDPLYAIRLPVIASADLPQVGVSGAIRFIVGHYADAPVLIVLGAIGLAALMARGRWFVAWGLVAFGPGVAAFLVFLAVRGIYISNRYIAPVDLAVIVAAGIGVASLRLPRLARLEELGSRTGKRAVIALAVGGLVAFSTVRPFGPIDAATRRAITINGLVHRDLGRVTAPIRAAIASVEHARDWPLDGSPTGATGTRAVLLVPILTLPQLAVDLRLPLSAATGTRGPLVRADGTYPRPGQLVFHDRDRDSPAAAFGLFEVDHPTTVGSITVDPLVVDPDGRFWLVRIRPGQ